MSALAERLRAHGNHETDLHGLEVDCADAAVLLEWARQIIEKAGATKTADGTYFDKDCACSLWLARYDGEMDAK